MLLTEVYLELQKCKMGRLEMIILRSGLASSTNLAFAVTAFWMVKETRSPRAIPVNFQLTRFAFYPDSVDEFLTAPVNSNQRWCFLPSETTEHGHVHPFSAFFMTIGKMSNKAFGYVSLPEENRQRRRNFQIFEILQNIVFKIRILRSEIADETEKLWQT